MFALQYLRGKSSKLHAKPLVQEIISSILNTFQNNRQYDRSAATFFTVNTVVHVYRDNEPVQGRIRQRLQPLTKHSHVISSKSEISGDVPDMYVGFRFYILGATNGVCHRIHWQH